MDKVQQLAGQIVCRVLGGRNLDRELDAVLQDAALTPQQRGALQDVCYGVLRFYGQLAHVLGQLLHKPVRDERLRGLLLVALYQLQFSRAAPYAVVDHAVRAARGLNAAAGGLTNAVLRNFLRRREALLAAAAHDEVARHSHPQWWMDRLRAQYGDRAEAVLQAGNRHPPMTLRVNARRISVEDYLSRLNQHGIKAILIEPKALLLEHPLPVDRLPGFFDGLVSVQDAGAQYAAPLLDARDGMRVLDACAAPGGKTTHLLERARLDLWALDKDPHRLARVRENLERLGFSATLVCGDASQPDVWWDGKPFQRILVDAPCSASGVARRHPDIKWLRRPEDIAGFAQQQSQILRSLWRLLAIDGKLLYATCSVFHQENQAVVDEFLRGQDDAERLPVEGLPVNDLKEGQLLPGDRHDGFFYALLRKTA